MITRRRFLGMILASACAPAIVRASSLMPLSAPRAGALGSFGTLPWTMSYRPAVLNEVWMAELPAPTLADLKPPPVEVGHLTERYVVTLGALNERWLKSLLKNEHTN